MKLEKSGSTDPEKRKTYTISFPVIIQSEFTTEDLDSASVGVNIKNGNSDGADFEFMTKLNIVRSYNGLSTGGTLYTY